MATLCMYVHMYEAHAHSVVDHLVVVVVVVAIQCVWRETKVAN